MIWVVSMPRFQLHSSSFPQCQWWCNLWSARTSHILITWKVLSCRLMLELTLRPLWLLVKVDQSCCLLPIQKCCWVSKICFDTAISTTYVGQLKVKCLRVASIILSHCFLWWWLVIPECPNWELWRIGPVCCLVSFSLCLFFPALRCI